MNKQLRILRIYYYGKIKLAKRMKQIAIAEWYFRQVKMLSENNPTPYYQYVDTATWEVKKSDTPVSATIKINQP